MSLAEDVFMNTCEQLTTRYQQGDSLKKETYFKITYYACYDIAIQDLS